jgi:hypothetical protein
MLSAAPAAVCDPDIIMAFMKDYGLKPPSMIAVHKAAVTALHARAPLRTQHRHLVLQLHAP